MYDKVVLTHTKAQYRRENGVYIPSFDWGGSLLALHTIANRLEELDFNNVRKTPSKPASKQELFEEVVHELGEAQRPILGISSWTDGYWALKELSSYVREHAPHTFIVGGGCHFQPGEAFLENGQRVPSSIEEALAEGHVDAVVAGHAQPFIDVVTRNIPVTSRLKGWYTLQNDKLQGYGTGSYPALSRSPLIRLKSEERQGVEELQGAMLVNDECSNGCSFCTINRRTTKVKPGTAIMSVLENFLGIEPVHIELVDSNPFEIYGGVNRADFYRNIFEFVKQEVNPNITWGAYLDPGLLVRHYDEMVDLIRSGPVTSLFMGRDAITERGARQIGSQYLNELRDQQELDAELDGITRLLVDLSATPVHVQKPLSLDLSYIFTPFMTPTEIEDVLEEGIDLTEHANEHVHMGTYPSDFTLFPGTHSWKTHIDGLREPQGYESFKPGNVHWKDDAGPSATIINELNQAGWNNRVSPPDQQVSKIEILLKDDD